MSTSTYPLYPPPAPPIPYPSDDDHSHEEINEPYLRSIEHLWHRFRHLVFFPNEETSITLACPGTRILAGDEGKIEPHIRVLRGVDDSESQQILRELFDKMTSESKSIVTCTTDHDGKETILKWWSEKT